MPNSLTPWREADPSPRLSDHPLGLPHVDTASARPGSILSGLYRPARSLAHLRFTSRVAPRRARIASQGWTPPGAGLDRLSMFTHLSHLLSPAGLCRRTSTKSYAHGAAHHLPSHSNTPSATAPEPPRRHAPRAQRPLFLSRCTRRRECHYPPRRWRTALAEGQRLGSRAPAARSARTLALF